MTLATQQEREAATASADTLLAVLHEPAKAGERLVMHIDMSRPRRGVWLATWAGLPGVSCDLGRKIYTHSLLPGWEYTPSEMRTELIQDLPHLAATGKRPTQATR